MFAVDAVGTVHWLYPGYQDATQDPPSILVPPSDVDRWCYLNETRNTGAERDSNRLPFGLMTGAAVWTAASSHYEAPIERMVHIWERDPGIRRVPRMSVSPLMGGATVELSGHF